MRNFKRYRHQDVVFRDGITGILGNNGAGKSTIVDAILFCLYGIQGTGLQYILSATAGKRDRARVRLDFSVRGEKYQLVRCLGPGKKHDARLHHAGRLLAKGVTEVQQATRKVIRMGHDDFRHTIFSGQRDLLTLVGAKPEERKQWFRKVLGIDSLKDEGGAILREEAEAARERMLLIAGRLGDTHLETIHGEQEGLARRIAEAREVVGALESQMQDLEGRSRSLEGEIAGLRGLEKDVLRFQTLIRNRYEELERLQEELGRVTRDLDVLGAKREEFLALQASEDGFEAIRGRLEAGRERRARFQLLEAHEARTRALAADVEKALARLKEEEALLSRDEARLGELGPLVAQRETALVRLREMRDLEGKYRTLLASLARTEESLAGAARRGAELHSRISGMKEARERLAGLVRLHAEEVPPEGDPVSVLESHHREVLARLAGSSAAREQAVRSLAEREKALTALGAQGAAGDCPTCHQPLGARYMEILEHLEKEREEERKKILQAGEAWKRAEEERRALESTLSEARRLREESGRLDEATRDWEAVQDLTTRELAAKDRLRQEVEALGYDPGARQRLEEEVASLDPAWKEQVAISDRLGRRPALALDREGYGARLESLNRELATLVREREELGFDPGDQARLETEYRAAEERHHRYLAMKPGMERLPHIEEVANRLTGKVREVQGEVKRLEAERAAIPFSPEALAAKERDLEAVRSQALGTAQKAAGARAEQVHLAAEERRLANLLVKFQLDRQEHDRLREEIGLLELTREQLNGFTDHLLGVVRRQVQELTGCVLSEITDGRYDTVILDDAFELLVHDLGGDFPVSRFSGGEQDDVAIAVRIALSRYIAGMHEIQDSTFLIFDEIFGSQDEERRANILRALRALEPFFPQIFLISHVTEVQGEFGNTLVVEAVSGSESRIRDLEGAAA
ncbi:MAG: SMC family ATPase [Methanomicrobiales archaeon]|nr:SMC family ATPase [Methanomicrobiales archaeon]